jgi:hypothetical protein
MPADLIPVRIARGRRRHALPQAGGDERLRTLCGRDARKSVIDDAFPDCKRCCAIIERTNRIVIQ